MGTILTLGVSIYFFIISHRLQFAYFLFVFLIPFLPKYIGFGVGSQGFSLSLIRILLMLLFISVFISFTQHYEYITKRMLLVYKRNKILINLLLVLFTLKVVSLSLNSRELSLYVMLFNDYLFSIFILMLTMLLIDSEEAFHRLVKIFFYSYTIVLILVLIETVLKFPLLSIFASGQMELNRDYSTAFSRAGSYRTNGSFLNPILLGEYLVMLFPFAAAYIHQNKASFIFKIGYFLLFIYVIYSTGSRSALLIFAGMVYLYVILSLYRRGRFTRFIANVFNIIIASIVFYFVFNYVSDLIMNFHGRFDKITDEEVRSSTSRALQYIRVYDKIQEAPLFGFGRMRDIRVILGSAIDNYYFWFILEVGIIGISIYILFLFTLVKTALNLYKSPSRNYYLLPLILAILMSILYQLLMANPANHIYLYIFAGLIAVMKVLQQEKHENSI